MTIEAECTYCEEDGIELCIECKAPICAAHEHDGICDGCVEVDPAPDEEEDD